jgi:hypothetical protein
VAGFDPICVCRLTRIGVLPINPGDAPTRSDRCGSAHQLLDFMPVVSGCGRSRDGEVPEWLKGTDCKSVGFAYVGSNPTLSTILPPNPEPIQRHRRRAIVFTPVFAPVISWIAADWNGREWIYGDGSDRRARVRAYRLKTQVS